MQVEGGGMAAEVSRDWRDAGVGQWCEKICRSEMRMPMGRGEAGAGQESEGGWKIKRLLVKARSKGE